MYNGMHIIRILQWTVGLINKARNELKNKYIEKNILFLNESIKNTFKCIKTEEGTKGK